MSCLSKEYRLNSSRDFRQIYQSGKKWHTPSFVAFFRSSEKLEIGFVTSKKVGNAVFRNKARRRLRAIVLENENKIITGKYVFVAKDELFNKSHTELQKDFNFAFKRLNLYK
ncbi:ribonuclease P protein component [Arcobacter sp. F2176]|uniref:ribonuclease P protein component n=1 Tax=unclassified Arcobacter TaxID=2593671 RepID=UPI00100C13FF|nr:ribonuclease P protein component [Arcobacter sp. F2176]